MEYHRASVVIFTILSCLQLTYGWYYSKYYMDSHCGSTINIGEQDAVDIDLTSSYHYASNMKCTVVIKAPPGRRIMAKFDSVDIEQSAFCTNDRLRMYDGPSTSSPQLSGSNGICGFVRPSKVYVTSTYAMTLRFTSDLSIQYAGFSLILTQFTNRCSNTSYSFQCRNSRCIDSDLSCDGWNNCGDDSDEVEGCGLSIGGIAGAIVGGFICFVILISVLIVCRRRRLRYAAFGGSGPGYAVTKTTTYNAPPPAGYAGYPQQPYQ